MRAIEETEGTGSPTVERQYVFRNGIDEALVMYDEDGEGGYDPYYYLSDPLWTVEALVEGSLFALFFAFMITKTRSF